MTSRLHAWLTGQSLAVKLLIAVPVLATALVWSTLPAEDAPPAGAGNRPVLAREAPAAAGSGALDASPAAGGAVLAPHQEPRVSAGELGWTTALRTVVSVAFVVGLIVVAARVLKRTLAGAGQLPGSGTALRVLETTYLPAPSGRGRSAMHLVEVGNRLLLVGATDGQLTLLAEFDDEDTTRWAGASRGAAMRAPQPAPPGKPAFHEALAAAAGAAPEPRAPGDLGAALDRLRQTRRRLEAGA